MGCWPRSTTVGQSSQFSVRSPRHGERTRRVLPSTVTKTTTFPVVSVQDEVVPKPLSVEFTAGGAVPPAPRFGGGLRPRGLPQCGDVYVPSTLRRQARILDLDGGVPSKPGRRARGQEQAPGRQRDAPAATGPCCELLSRTTGEGARADDRREVPRGRSTNDGRTVPNCPTPGQSATAASQDGSSDTGGLNSRSATSRPATVLASSSLEPGLHLAREAVGRMPSSCVPTPRGHTAHQESCAWWSFVRAPDDDVD